MARCEECVHFGICKKGFPFADGKGGGWCEDFLTADVAPKSEWISVDDRLPEECTHVIVHDEDGTVGEAFYSRGGYFEWVANEKIAFSTHWMPMPEPPITDKPTQE